MELRFPAFDRGLSRMHRCIAIDHLGFGLSDKPASADYTVAAHARRFQDFIHHLELKDITLVVTDFGGGIGLQHALEHPENVSSIVLYNTWMWPLNEDKRFAGPARMVNSWLGRMLYLHLGFSVNVLMRSAYGDKKKLTKAVHAHFKNALPDPVPAPPPSSWPKSSWMQVPFGRSSGPRSSA
ncbi:MAG: alpha/beta fold hydrolase [Flavobacteriales bacterium]